MALTRLNIGTNDDGTPRHHYHHDASDGTAAVYTGPHARGSVTLGDGTVYDVGPDVIEVKAGHEGEVSHHIGVRYEQEGHPAHKGDGEPFVHLCTDHCGAVMRPADHPQQREALRRLTRQIIHAPHPHAPAHFYVTDAAHVAQVKEHADDVVQAMQARVDAWRAAPSTAAEAYQALSMLLASAAAENAALNGLDGTGSTNVIPDLSLHTASPSTTGANENANTGSYARQAGAWNAASGGSKTNSGTVTFATAGSVADTHVGTWSSATYGAGTYAIGGALTASVTSTSITFAAGSITLSAT